jgi:WD40 repeat protein
VSAQETGSPFKGLASFEDSDADARFFFGREREREIIVANLLASRLTVLYGESGVGKSSVLRAGVARDLRALPEPLAVAVFADWRDDPARALEARIAEATGAEPQGRLADTLELGAGLVGGEVYVILDGVEEESLYHEADAGPGSFLDEFSEAATRPGMRASFLLAVREDALAKLDRFKSRVPNVFGNYLRLDHLDRPSGREAIVGPVDRWNESAAGHEVSVEPALVEAVLDQVAAGRVELGQTGRGGVGDNGSGGIEAPYLQLVMARLWEAEAEAGSTGLRHETLVRLGGAEQIVRDHLERALESLDPAQQDVAAAVFNHLVTPSGTKIAHDASDLAGYLGVAPAEVEPVLSSLAAERILRPVPGVRGSSLPRYEIYHDILAEAVLAWRTRHESGRALERVQAEASRRHRKLMFVAVGALLLAAAMAIVTVFAFTQRSDAQSQTRKAHAIALDSAAKSQLTVDPELSLALAVESAERERSVQAEDVLRGALAASRLRAEFRADGPVAAAHFSRDGSRLLVAGGTRVRVYDSRSRALLLTLDHGAPVTAADFSADGGTIVTGGADGQVDLWSARRGRQMQSLRLGAPVRSVDFDPRGKRLVAAGGRRVRVWRVGQAAPLWGRHLGWPVTEAVLGGPYGSVVAVIGNHPDAVLFDAVSGRLLHRLNQGDFVKAVAFSPDGDLVVTGGRNATARIWNVASGRMTAELTGHTEDVVALAFSPDGSTLATASADGSARTWSVADGKPESLFVGHAGPLTSVEYSPNAQYLLTSSVDHTARVWRIHPSALLAVLLAGDSLPVTSAEYSPDGSRVLTASLDGTARLWDPRQPTFATLRLMPGPVQGASYAGPDRIAVAGPGKSALLIRASDGKTLARLTLTDVVAAARVSSDGKLFAVAAGRQVVVYRLARPTPIPIPQPSVPTAIAFSPDGAQLAVAYTDGSARVWTLFTSKVVVLGGRARGLTDIAFSPDGTLVATASRDGKARLWDVRSGRLVRTLAGHTKPLTSVAFSPDGKAVLTASADRDAKLWATGKPTQTMTWHFGTVADAAFSPDQRWIVTAGPVTAQLWQAKAPVPFFPLGIGGVTKKLTSVSFDPTSRIVLATSEDGTIRTYRCVLCGTLDELLRVAHKRLALTRRTLSPAEIARFGG